MTKEWDKAKAGFEKLQPKLKKLDLKEAEKRKKQVQSAVKQAWAAEDVFADALEAAGKAGVTGKKLADFASDGDVKSSLAAFKKASQAHRQKVKALSTYCDPAAPLCQEARALKSVLGKEMKKAKATLGTKENNDFLRTAKAQTEVIEAVNKVQGSLTASEFLYGGNFARLAEAVFKKATKQGSASKAEVKAKDLIELKTLGANEKAAKGHAKLVDKHCAAALAALKDGAKAAAADAKKAAQEMAALDTLAKQYSEVMRKSAALIKASPDSSKIKRGITNIMKAHKPAAQVHAAAKAELDNASA